MRRRTFARSFPIAAGLALLAGADAGAQSPIAVPAGTAVPVLLDGRLSPGEWDDAKVVPVQGAIALLLKQVDGHVFIAARTEPASAPRPVDIFLATGAGPVHQLHASAAIGERVLVEPPFADDDPPWVWGNHVDWIANEAKVDSRRASEPVIRDRFFVADGVEFQIRRSRFPGAEWRVRVEIGSIAGADAGFVFPPGSDRDDPATWAVLRLDPA